MSGERLTVSIEEVAAIDALYDLAADYRRRHGREPVEISHWDPSVRVMQAIGTSISVPKLGEPLHYRYSFESDCRSKILHKLGYSSASRRILLTENGTNAVLAVANALALLGVKQVALLSPSYFATKYAIKRFGLKVRRVFWRRERGSFVVPEVELAADEALWAESPIFGTGVSADGLLENILKDLADQGRVLIYDRSLERDAGPLAASLEGAERYFSIHAPHKTICVNGLKFGAATFHGDLYDAFDHWADVLAGGLSLSAEAATRHFVSPAFDSYEQAVADYVTLSGGAIHKLAVASPVFEADDIAVGYWRTLYAPRLPANLGNASAWVASLIDRTGAIPIPGIWTGCSPDWGFCFRINLLRYDPQFRAGLRRLISAMELDQNLAPP